MRIQLRLLISSAGSLNEVPAGEGRGCRLSYIASQRSQQTINLTNVSPLAGRRASARPWASRRPNTSETPGAVLTIPTLKRPYACVPNGAFSPFNNANVRGDRLGRVGHSRQRTFRRTAQESRNACTILGTLGAFLGRSTKNEERSTKHEVRSTKYGC